MDFENKKLTYNDYLDQIKKVKDEDKEELKKMLEKMPGGADAKIDISEEELQKIEKIILSMTEVEREGDVDISNDRRKEIAEKASVDVEEVHRLIKGFNRAKLLLKGMQRFKRG